VPLKAFREITAAVQWKAHVERYLGAEPLSGEEAQAFNTHWIEAGHHIREQLSDDKLLVRLLRHLLPRYEGGGHTLFRGENLKRWERGDIGLAWTSKRAVAEMFGSGLNAHTSGGVLLEASVPAHAVICINHPHSNYLDESQFTIDPSLIENCVVIRKYPPAFAE